MANSEQYVIKVVITGSGTEAVASIDSVNKKLKEQERAAEDAGKSANNLSKQWSAFKDTAGNLLGAAAVVTALTAQVYGLGQAVNAAETTFQQVSGGADAAAESLARMRQMTGGVIDDLSLMKGANSLLVTGIAQTNQQAEQLVNLGARLGAVMGVDATESIQNLNAALLNNSFMRLDTLGISAARVRERVNELKAAGLDMSAAFSQAVIEIGGQTLEDLGVAAGVAETAVGRLSTRLQNAGAQGAEFFADKINEAATSLEQLIILAENGELWRLFETLGLNGVLGIRSVAPGASEATGERQMGGGQIVPLAEQYRNLQLDMLEAAGILVSDFGLSTQEAISYYKAQNAELQDLISTGSFFLDSLGEGADPAMRAQAEQIISEALPELDISLLSDDELTQLARDLDIAFSAVGTAETALELQVIATNEALLEQERILAEAASADAFLLASTQAKDNLMGLRREADLLSDAFRSGVFTNSSGMTFFDPEQLDEVRSQTEDIVAEYERLKALGESSDFTLVSELEVENAREIADLAEETATQAERNAKAWETASLAMIAGATGGGRQNEFNQMVLANIEDPELRAQAEQSFNLASGVETAETQLTEYGAALVAAITEEFGVAAGNRAGQDFVTAFEEGIAMGLTGEELQDYVEEQVGYALGTSADGGTSAGGGEQITIQAGEGYQAVAARTGYTVEELMAATGGRMLMAGEVITVGDSQLIALDENTPVGTVGNAAGNVMGNITGANGIVSISDSSAAPMMAAPTSDYTYYNPATGTYESSNNPAAAPIAPETAEAVSSVEEDMLSIDTSVQSVAAADLSVTFDPMISDIDEVKSKTDEFSEKLTEISNMELSIELPISFVFDTVSADIMSRNSSVVELFRLVLPQVGVQTS